MTTLNLINDWLENMVENADLESDQFVVALSDTAPGSETTPPTGDGDGILGNVTEVAYTNCSTRNITTSSSGQTSGTYSLVLTDITLSASGGPVPDTGTFRYVYIYNDTVATPADPIVGYYDYGSAITLADGENILVDFGASLFTNS